MAAIAASMPRRTLGAAAGIGVAVGVYAVSFGVLAVSAGLSPAQACVMSILAPILPARLRDRALAAQLVIDESTAMARAEEDPVAARRAFLATGVSVWVCWNAGTLAGAMLGSGLGDPRALGLDAMFPAAFLALLAPQLRRPGAPAAAAAGALIAVALVPFTPAGVPVIAALAGMRGSRP